MGLRRKAREVVLQVLYAQSITGDPVEGIITDQLAKNEYDEEVCEFVQRLAACVVREGPTLDRIIEERATNWDIGRIALIDKLILRMGLCELLYFPDIPARVCINESIEMSKKYSSADSKRFVNGILDAAYKDTAEEHE
jgi:N utilization substance protein B